ncbi:MAG: tetratricopeptide repeat protein [Betaproteobacteria bacterium]
MKATRKSGKTVGALMVALLVASFGGRALAAGGSPDPSPPWPADPVVERVTALTEKKDWKGAVEVLVQAVAANPSNAEYHNLYAYTVRKSPAPDMNLVFKQYGEALRLRPDYRGAHEYIGEAYLMVDNLPKAKEHLALLDRLCTFGCEEYTDLKKAVAAYEARRK